MTARLLSVAPGELDTLTTAKLLDGWEWSEGGTSYPERFCPRTEVSPGVYHLNSDGTSAPLYGGAYATVVAPPNALFLGVECQIKLPPGVASSDPAALSVYAGTGVSQTVTPAAEWQTLRVRFALSSGMRPLISLVVGEHFSLNTGPQGQVLVRGMRAWVEGGTSRLCSPAVRRYDISRQPLLWGAFGSPAYTDKGPQTPPHAHVEFETNAPWVAFSGHCNALPQFADHAAWLVEIDDGAQHIVVQPLQFGEPEIHEIALPPGRKRVRLYGGLLTNQPSISGQPDDIRGTFLRDLWIPDGYETTFARPAYEAVEVWVGASFCNGFFCPDKPQVNSFLGRRRARLRRLGIGLIIDGQGFRPTYRYASTPERRAEHVAHLAAAKVPIKRIVIDAMCNDFARGESVPPGGGLWTAAEYGIGLAAYVDLLHERMPDVEVCIIGGMEREGDDQPNGLGDNFDDYRDAGRAVAEEPERAGWCRYIDAKHFVPVGELSPLDSFHPGPDTHATIERRLAERLG